MHVSTMATLMAISVSKLVAFGFVGMAIGAYLPLIVLMILGTVAGNWIGQRTLTECRKNCSGAYFRCCSQSSPCGC